MYTIVSTYACINDTINYQSDTLITFALDLANYDDFSLSFDSYYDGQGTRASVIYSLDGGISYHLLSEIIPASEWQHTIIDLDEFSGITGQLIWLGFTASQWAVDNVEVSVLEYTTPYLLGYHVFLNDSLVTETTDTSWQFEDLKYGETYTASVGALYGCGLSKKLYESFLSGFQYPPRNLFAASYDNSIYLMWEPPLMPDTSSGDPCRDLWDTQFSFPCGDASGEAGVESDGNYIYTTKWNAGNGTFFRYELDGTFMGSFVIDVCMDVRDLAYDGELFWGSNAGTLV